MAETLRMPEGSNMSPDAYHALLEQYEDADAAVASAVAERKDLRQKIKATGMPLAAFDRSRRDAEKSAAKRDHEERWYQTMMAWQGKPVPNGGQAEMEFGVEDNEVLAARRLRHAEKKGYEAGLHGDRGDANPWPAGSEEFATWLSSWTRGQAEKVSKMGTGAANGSARKGKSTGKPRGRPPGTGKKQREAAAAAAAAADGEGEGSEGAGDAGSPILH
jgi:ribosome modulation factor